MIAIARLEHIYKYTSGYIGSYRNMLSNSDLELMTLATMQGDRAGCSEDQVVPARQSRDGGVSARILHFGNGTPPIEVACAKTFYQAAKVFRITDDYTAFVDDGRQAYSVIFIVGSDPVRIRKFMRIYRPLLKSKAKIALLREARPRARVQLLNIGFDDVFDFEMTPAEGQARIMAILGRKGQRQTDDLLRDVRELHVQHYVVSPLLGRESRILSLLVAAKGAPVRTERLAATGRSAHRPISPKSLQVLISGLRAKLKPTIRITSRGSSGYALQEVSPAAVLLATAAGGSDH